jgi:hypothetical protein
MSQIYLPKWEFRRFIDSLSTLIREGALKKYHYIIQDMYQNWRQTIPYQHFDDGTWNYDNKKYNENIMIILKEHELVE